MMQPPHVVSVVGRKKLLPFKMRVGVISPQRTVKGELHRPSKVILKLAELRLLVNENIPVLRCIVLFHIELHRIDNSLIIPAIKQRKYRVVGEERIEIIRYYSATYQLIPALSAPDRREFVEVDTDTESF
jgi:hypothetical protein